MAYVLPLPRIPYVMGAQQEARYQLRSPFKKLNIIEMWRSWGRLRALPGAD